MPAPLAFASYFLYSYIALPLLFTGATFLYSKRYEFCPVVKCIGPLSRCIREPECKAWLDELPACSDPHSEVRKRSARTFAHVQHPRDPAYCQYQSFDRIRTNTSLTFLECIGNSGCLAPAQYTDTCAASILSSSVILPLDVIPADVLHGTWNKLYTTGWDLWPCQWTKFWPPAVTKAEQSKKSIAEYPEPDSWMKEWPNALNVWRMDLYWQNSGNDPVTFHMDNEMYPGKTWNFSSTAGTIDATPAATLRTRAVMWGTEAHENWYLLDYHAEWETMMVYFCAYTDAVNRFDSMTMVLKKRREHDEPGVGVTPYSSVPIHQEQEEYFQRRALELLGEEHGNLQRVPSCKK